MPRYAIPINENSLPLIGRLNGGVRPGIEERSTYFIADIPESVVNDIQFEDDLYDENGHAKEEMIWVVV